MAKKMLIDAAHPEQTRVVVVSGNRVEEFDFETAAKKQLKGNIYLAKVTRVEPSLQAAFIEYGGNRHGFLAFGEIHPDYYQIPVEDRLALLQEQAAEGDDEDEPQSEPAAGDSSSEIAQRETAEAEDDRAQDEAQARADQEPREETPHSDEDNGTQPESDAFAASHASMHEHSGLAPIEVSEPAPGGDEQPWPADPSDPSQHSEPADGDIGEHAGAEIIEIQESKEAEAAPESVGAEDAMEELPRRRFRQMRRYKIQEVIKRRQILLVQVVKEERGNKGAALTTFLSLAGRYCVLMPNTDRGGGISRKITSGLDRQRLKDIATDLEVPEGMGLIIRTAGANRTRAELKRDFEYLLRLWESVRELTLKSSAPALVYEEGNLVKRSIRDLYGRDIESVQVEGEEAYKEAKAFMKMLTPSHAKNVQQYRDKMPLFQRYQVETYLDGLFSPTVELRSGGYIVMNSTEALVAIDVNSGKSTREHTIEETALRTNLEAAEEVARQLRLRDLAGLIVIDFIDMEEHRHNRAVERRLKDCLKTDRARIQVGRISAFGLLEMSRQRLRASVLEGSTLVCPHCTGAGRVSSVEMQTLRILRAIEEEGVRGRIQGAHVKAPTDVAFYLLNHKRDMLRQIEERFGLPCYIEAIATMRPGQFSVEKEEAGLIDWRPAQAAISPDSAFIAAETEEAAAEAETEAELDSDAEPIAVDSPRPEKDTRGDGDGDASRRRRRRRRGGRRGDEREPMPALVDTAPAARDDEADEDAPGERPAERIETDAASAEERRKRRRRGRRGGRRNRQDRPEGAAPQSLMSGDVAGPAPPDAGADQPFTDHTTPSEYRGDPPPPETFEPLAPLDERASIEDNFRSDAREPISHDLTRGDHPIATEPEPVREEAPAAPAWNGHSEPERSVVTEARLPEPPPEAEDPNRPRRKGWWQKRLFG